MLHSKYIRKYLFIIQVILFIFVFYCYNTEIIIIYSTIMSALISDLC
nr:MAG TPA: hypothetical protein [Caudoviricetes sp.]